MIEYASVIKMKRRLQGSLLILLGTIIWGSSFVAQSVGMDHVGPFTFQGIRCMMAVMGLLPVIWIADRGKKDGKTFWTRFCDKRLLLAGLLCGIPLCFAVNLQQIGIQYTSSGKAAFITAMYIVFVPIIGLFLKRKPSPMIPLSVVIAVAGLYFLSCMGDNQISFGDFVLLGCAVAFALQITVVDHFANSVDGLRLNCLQSAFCSIVSLVIMLLTETPTLEGIRGSFLPMCYSGFLSMGAAYSLQILGQQRLESTPASLIMSLESVFAVLFGWLFLQEIMTFWEALGCVLVFTAVILSQIPIPVKKKQSL